MTLKNIHKKIPRLGVNIDHIATLRQLRGTPYPNLLAAADEVLRAGAHQITAHLREDRRHIQDKDVFSLRKKKGLYLNLEMAVTPEMVAIAERVRPQRVCLVPEKRQELTTEGGLDIKKLQSRLASVLPRLQKKGIKVSLFIEPSLDNIKIAKKLKANAVELHTGTYCLASDRGNKKAAQKELKRIFEAALLCRKLGLECHAGHGIHEGNVRALVDLEVQGEQLIQEYNIGHSIVCRAVEVGLRTAVREMLSLVSAP